MQILGYVCQGDEASCGAVVEEGSAQDTSDGGRAYTFKGARMHCDKRCVIVDGVHSSALSNGRPQVVHGMLTTHGCSLISKLNGTDGECI